MSSLTELNEIRERLERYVRVLAAADAPEDAEERAIAEARYKKVCAAWAKAETEYQIAKMKEGSE